MAILKAGDCVGVLYRTTMGAPAKVRDGVLVSPKIIDTTKPLPKQVTVIHITINRQTGHLIRQSNLKISNVVDIKKTPFKLSDQQGRCAPKPTSPNIRGGACVAVKFKINSPAFPGGREVKNGRLLCPINNGLKPPSSVWIYHWKINNAASDHPTLRLELKRYNNVTFVQQVKLHK